MSNSKDHVDGKTDENASRPQSRGQGDASGAEPQARPQEQVNADAQYETAAGAQAPSSPETVTTPPASEAEVTFSENAEATYSATSPGVVLPDAATLSAPAALSAIGPTDAGSPHHVGDSDDLDFLLAAAAQDTLNLDPLAEQRRRNRLTNLRQQAANLLKAEIDKHETAVAGLETAREQLTQSLRDRLNAEVAIKVRGEQIESSARRKAEHEAEIAKIDHELRLLAMTPTERAADEARRRTIARKAAEKAAHEAWLDELVPVERPYMRIEPGRFDRDQSRKWKPRLASDVTFYSVKRRDVEKHTAEMAEAAAWIAEQRRLEERNELAAEYEDELRTNGRRTFFRTARERVEYFSAWGQDSLRGRAYRERQRERGLPEADPAKTPSGGYFIAPGGGLAGWR